MNDIFYWENLFDESEFFQNCTLKNMNICIRTIQKNNMTLHSIHLVENNIPGLKEQMEIFLLKNHC